VSGRKNKRKKEGKKMTALDCDGKGGERERQPTVREKEGTKVRGEKGGPEALTGPRRNQKDGGPIKKVRIRKFRRGQRGNLKTKKKRLGPEGGAAANRGGGGNVAGHK